MTAYWGVVNAPERRIAIIRKDNEDHSASRRTDGRKSSAANVRTIKIFPNDTESEGGRFNLNSEIPQKACCSRNQATVLQGLRLGNEEGKRNDRPNNLLNQPSIPVRSKRVTFERQELMREETKCAKRTHKKLRGTIVGSDGMESCLKKEPRNQENKEETVRDVDK